MDILRKAGWSVVLLAYIGAIASPFWYPNSWGIGQRTIAAYGIATTLGLIGFMLALKYSTADYPYDDAM